MLPRPASPRQDSVQATWWGNFWWCPAPERAHLAHADLMSMYVFHTPSWKQKHRQLSAALTSGRPAH